ncbi:MAG TPA: putative LPS assembly protein LptD, partial [Flavobacteriaceae bacterium]|nr:putative LPS assembly protein LptD [Flavobacteriaceae bacterium]
MLSTQLLSIFIKTQSIKTFLKNNLFLVVLIWFSLTNVNLFSQELGTQLNDTIKAKTPPQALIKQDTTVVSVDTVIQPKEMLEYVIEHTADSLIKQDFIKKRIYLFKNAQLVYGDITLKAGYIEIDNNTNTVIAKGIKDSIGNYVQLPEFTQGGQSSTQDSIVYNFNSEKAKIHNLQTEQQGLIIRGNESKKYNDSVIFIRDIKITSSKKEKPDYYIRVNKAKFIKNKKLVAGPSQLVIADVPTPAVLPFAYVPLSKGRTSGFLMPTWGENNNQGYFLQNGGYYFVVNDNMDLAVLGDIYTNGSWGLRLESGYAKRYRYSGRFNFRYENLINSLKGFSDYRKASNYNITWSHSQDQKASPNSRFSASVNLGSSKYYKQSYNEYNNNSFLNNTLSSSISYQKNFVGTPFNMSLSATHSQNTNTEQITMTLPSLQVNMDRIYPFAGKGGVKRNAIQKTGLTYSMRGENRINTTDDEFF